MTISDYSASVGSLVSLEYLEGVLLTPRSVQKVLEEEWMSVHWNELRDPWSVLVFSGLEPRNY